MSKVGRDFKPDGKRGSSLTDVSLALSMMASPYGFASAPAVGCGRLFRADFLSSKGKWLHLGKLLTVMFIPILGGWAFTMYSLADNVMQKDATVEVAQRTMLRAIKLGRLIYTIQKERDMSVLYVSAIGPGTKAFLIEGYDNTNHAFAEMWDWPEEFTLHHKTYFRSKMALLNHINTQRNKLDPSNPDLYGEIRFYSEIVEFIMTWMIDRIGEGGFGNIWKSLVVFQKITRCMLDTGAERALGAMFYAQGNFLSNDIYDDYFRRIFRFNYNYRSSTYYSDLVDPLMDSRTDQLNYTTAIRALRDEIKYSNFTGLNKSTEKAQHYFDNVTFRIDHLKSLQEAVASRVIDKINKTVNEYVQNIIVYSVTATLVIISCPFIMFLSENLTSNMQSYSKVLVRASDELNQEKSRTDSLLYQMLPKPVAERLKRKSNAESEFFRSATVMFTGVVNFTQLSIEYSPMELVDLLNILYTAIDEKIDKYDVYKVETINETYMVVSGVPTPNGMRHATEIAYLSLDIMDMSKSNRMVTPNIKNPIQLRTGASTGSVSAGVVGNVTLRYCLFGDTVNTASRMKSYSEPNRIHISESTFRNLDKTKLFNLTKRGTIAVKGKGEMTTYWLLDSTQKYSKVPSTWQLPGEVQNTSETISRVSESFSVEQGTSQEPEPRQSRNIYRKFSTGVRKPLAHVHKTGSSRAIRKISSVRSMGSDVNGGSITSGLQWTY